MQRRYPSKRLTSGLLLAGVLLAGPALAAEDPALRTTTVRYTDLDLATAEGARALYGRILSAARRVCPEPSQWNRKARSAMRRCRAEAIAAAVARVGNARLAALASTRRPAG